MINKEQAARRLIHAAIRNIAREEDPVANHVLVMACGDLLREYCEAKGLTHGFEISAYLAPDRRREIIKDYIKKGYYFLKHARLDSDDMYDETNLAEVNKAMTLINCLTFQSVFGQLTRHMALLLVFEQIEHPQLLTEQGRKMVLATPVAMTLAQMSLNERRASFADSFNLLPELRVEKIKDGAVATET